MKNLLLLIFGLLLVTSYPVCSSESIGPLYYTACPVANVYAYPDTNSVIRAQTFYGQRLVILQTKEGWNQVETRDDVAVGWVDSDKIHTRKCVGPCPYPSSSNTVYIKTPITYLYSKKRAIQSNMVMRLPSSVILEMAPQKEESFHWIEVVLLDGTKAYIQRKDVVLPLQFWSH